MAVGLKLFIILFALVIVNGLNPMEKLQDFKEKTTAAIGQMKHKITTYKEQTQVKLQNMKAYMNYLKNMFYAKAFPYSGKAIEHAGYDYKFPGYVLAKPAVTLDHTVYDHKFPEYQHHDQPYSYVQVQSGPDHLYKTGILH